MTGKYEIRADYDRNTIVVYQAYSSQIAEPALKNQCFVPPFSYHRMTWIKPSFLWLMHRSNWGQKKGQEKILGITMSKEGWNEALKQGVLTHPEPSVHHSYENWKRQFLKARVHIQWDPERSIGGKGKNHYAIQVGISRFLMDDYVNRWIHNIRDYTPLTRKIHALLRSGKKSVARKLLPKEKPLKVSPEIGKKLLIS